MAKSNKKMTRRELRNLRLQQLIFVLMAVIVILSMIVSLVSR